MNSTPSGKQPWRNAPGAAVAVAFSVAGLAIIAGFYYNWHPLGGYLPK